MDRLRYGQSPDAVFVLAFVGLVAFVMALAGYLPPALEDSVPHWVGTVWASVLAGGCLISLIGLGLKDEPTSWAVELMGRPGVAGTCVGYTWFALTNMSDAGDFLGLAFFGGVAFASGVRAVQLYRRQRSFRWAMRVQGIGGG